MDTTRLIERCRQGDADALGELYKAYAQRMRGVCRRYISDEQTVDDVLHDAFVIIFTSFDRLRDDRKAEAWMMAITRNVASKCKERLAEVKTVPLEEAAMVSQHTEQGDVKGVPLNEVVRMIDRLPEGYGQVFRLSVFDGLSHKEIADMLGIEPHSSSSQLARAKKMLRKMMRQYWAAGLLLLLLPLTFLLFRNQESQSPSNSKEEKTVAAKQEDKPKEQPQEPVIASLPVRRTHVITEDTLQSVTDEAAQEKVTADTPASDSAMVIRKDGQPHYDMAELLPDRPASDTNSEKKWSLELAYTGQIDEQSRYNQPFSYTSVPTDVQSLPSGQEPTVPGSIDNWTDYAVYLANNPDAVSDKTRSVIMRIALNNASRPGDGKISRTSHHRMPVTWSLAVKYNLNHRFGLESGLQYSRLSSDFEMGADGNTISEHQTIHYLGIPVKGIYNMYNGKRWGLYGSLGLTTEMPVHSALQSDFYVNGQYETSDKMDIRAPWQFSTTFGLGLQYHLTPSVGFFAEPSLQYYIPTHSDIETYRTEHPFSFSLPLGIRFTW